MLTYLAAGITKEGKIDTGPIDRMALNIELRKFKSGNTVKFGELLKIPSSERISNLAKNDLRGTVTTISVALTLAFETMNLKRGMTPIQIVDLAETIVDDSEGDKISIPDLLLFLQRLTRGEYGELYDSFDSVKFMRFFGQFRDERWSEGIRIRDERDLEYKNLGDPERVERKNTAFDEHLSAFTTKLSAMKDELREAKKNKK